MAHIRHWFIAAAAAVGTVSQLHAQVRADALCWRARPAVGCRAFLLTNFGVYPSIAGQLEPNRMLEDMGLMFNVTPRDAVGASFFVAIAQGGAFTSGPALRYRRWTGPRASLDVAVGFRTPAQRTDNGAVFALVKYSPAQWIGLALRPEILRSPGSGSRLRISAGIELGWWPGLVVPAIGAAIGGIIYASHPPSF